MTEHTPTPWAWTEGTPTITRKWNGKENPIATVNGALAWHEDRLCSSREAGANAAFICKAVNSHDEIVSALQDILKWYGGDTEDDSEWSDCMLRARKALSPPRTID